MRLRSPYRGKTVSTWYLVGSRTELRKFIINLSSCLSLLTHQSTITFTTNTITTSIITSTITTTTTIIATWGLPL